MKPDPRRPGLSNSEGGLSIVDPVAAPFMSQPNTDSLTEIQPSEQAALFEHDPRSVGIVETKYLTLFEPPNPLILANGAKLGPITVAYETYGTLNSARDNAIFVCHALTGDAHMAGRRANDDRKPGWWDELVGPGKGLDTSRYFIICANVLGGCQGTTGPGSIDPGTGERFGLRFPFITFGDIVSVHSELVRKLGIGKLLAVIGGSVGGMQVLEWAAKFPDQIHSAICLASGPRLSAQGIAFNMVGRRAITSDPNFAQGDYYGDGKGSIINIETGPKVGLALARMVAHITYLSEESIEQKFGRHLQHREQFTYDMSTEVEFKVESYLNYQGQRFVERFDANSYLYLTRAMDYFDLNRDFGELPKAFAATKARFLVVSYTSDWLFTTAQSKQVVAALIKEHKHVTFVELESPFGHDSFLLEVEPLQELLEPFLSQTHAGAKSTV